MGNQINSSSPESIANLFEQVPFLSPLSYQKRLALANEAEIHQFAAGDHIMHEGASGDSLYIIQEGTVLIYKLLRGEVFELARRGAGTFVGEMALIEDTVRSASVRADTDVHAVEITRGGFRRLLSRNPDVAFAVMREISRRLRQTDSNLIEYLLDKNRQLQRTQQDLRESYDATLIALSNALDLRDTETEGHSVRVAELAVDIGRNMNISDDKTEALWHGALLHDIGKIGIPDRILNKAGQLTPEEWQIMRQHPIWGAEIVSSIDFLSDAVVVVRHHHEAWDGSGYPDGLSGENIPRIARIFMVADTYDAVTSNRPYRAGRSPQVAWDIIVQESGRRFDPDVVDAFKNTFPNIRNGL